MAIDKVSITGIEAFGFHGVFEHERKEGQEFTILLKLFKQTS
jgi:dihydroneopterin aldolase